MVQLHGLCFSFRQSRGSRWLTPSGTGHDLPGPTHRAHAYACSTCDEHARTLSLRWKWPHGRIHSRKPSKTIEFTDISFHQNCPTTKNIGHTHCLACSSQAYTMWGHTLQVNPANSEPVPLQVNHRGGARRIALKPRSSMGCLEGARAVLPMGF